MKIVLITGCSSGIGRAAVQRLAGKAHVVATARNLGDIRDLEGPHVDSFQLDVTDRESRRQCVESVLDHLGRIDCLVNNAGYGPFMPLEETDEATMQALFDVNVFGLHEMTRLVLPHMRAQGSGRIVNVASIVGHVSAPFIGAYAASKHAVRAMTVALDSEVRAFGIRTSLVEPGRIATRFSHRGRDEGRPVPPHYEAQQQRYLDKYLHHGGAPPERIARYIERACLARRPRFHYLGPWDAKALKLTERIFGDGILRMAGRYMFGRPRREGEDEANR